MHTAMWIIPIAPFILALATTWSIREAIEETVWFNVAYVGVLAIIYAIEFAGFEFVSTSPTGSGGLFAMIAGFIALGVQRYRYKQEKQRKAEAKAIAEAEARARRAKDGQLEERSLIVDAFRIAGNYQRARKNAKR